MSGTKAALKAVGEAVKQQKYDEAIVQARELLQKSPDNYQAHLFLGFALDKTNRRDDAVQTYLRATGLKAGDPQAWQGLVKVYGSAPSSIPLTASAAASYRHAAVQLASIYVGLSDLHRAQDVVNKHVDFVRARSGDDRMLYVDALALTAPASPLYDALEGRFPHPAKTLDAMAAIVEAEDRKRINVMIGERRTRIGARLADVTLEVKRDVFAKSPLEGIYRQLIDWAKDDELRRSYEEKLMQYAYDRLLVAPAGEQKAKALAEVQDLASGMVIIKHPFQLAWDVELNWKDAKELTDYDVNVLGEYCAFFPESDLAKALVGFMSSDFSPFPKAPATPQEGEEETAEKNEDDSSSTDGEDGGAPTVAVPLTEEDRLVAITESASASPSLLAYRLFGEYYQQIEEHESIVEMMRKAIEHLEGVRVESGLPLLNTRDAFCLYLGTALVFYQSPRHHAEAKTLFEQVLAHDATSTPAMIGVGLIFEEEMEYDAAIDFLERALGRDPSNARVRTEAAWVKALKGDYATAKAELQAALPSIDAKGQSSSSSSKQLLAQTQYRIGQCLWNLNSSKAARKDRKGAYAYFLDALKSDLNFAPAYTSLGVYYADYARDRKRALRCFLKAVELSAAEVSAAERLARLFADDGDWDRVELVAQRVVDSGRVKPPPGSKRRGISWPFAALGVAELNKQDHAKAVASFQAALRISPHDYHAWVGLGESYANSGRYVAATKTIAHAQTLEEDMVAEGKAAGDDLWFTKYMLANVKRELGEFDEAVDIYREVTSIRPREEGVVIALMQAMVDGARRAVDTGFFGKAVELAADIVALANDVRETAGGNFNFWKSVGDACAVFATVQSRVSEFPTDAVRALLSSPVPSSGSGGAGDDDDEPDDDAMADIDGVGTGVVFAKGLFPDDEKVGVDLTRALHACLLCHKLAIRCVSPPRDVHALSVAFYNLGWAEHSAHLCLPPSLRRRASRYLRAAIACFKRAIELEAANADFWAALGVATAQVNARVSQHALVRSLHINERSAATWTNLGALALTQGDAQAANEAFTRAQSTDPDYANAWLGQGLVAALYGDAKEARALFTHALEMADASNVPARRTYVASVFDHMLLAGPTASSPANTLIQPLLALSQLRSLRPLAVDSSGAFHHLSSLFLERAGDHAAARHILERLADAAEQDYEATESESSLARYVLASADLARQLLARGEWADAAKVAGVVLQLTARAAEEEEEEEEGEENLDGSNSNNTTVDGRLTPAQARRARLSARLTAGLARFFAGRPDDAVPHLEAAAEETKKSSSSSADPDALCLLAQTLWATDTADDRDRARDLLFEVVGGGADGDEEEEGGEGDEGGGASHAHLPAVLLLGVIALLDDDADAVDAVRAELLALRMTAAWSAADERVRGDIDEVLAAITEFAGAAAAEDQEATRSAVLAQAQSAVLVAPHLPHGWLALASAAAAGTLSSSTTTTTTAIAGFDISSARAHATRMAGLAARRALPPRGSLRPEELAKAYAAAGTAAQAQRAVFVAPWTNVGWAALNDAVVAAVVVAAAAAGDGNGK